MHQFRFAVATRCFAEPLRESLKSAADLTVSGLQLDLRNEIHSAELTSTGRRDLLHRIGEMGLTIGSAVFPLNHPLYESDKVDVRMAAIREAMKFAYSIKAQPLCIRVGKIPDESLPKERKLLLEVLTDLAGYSSHIGTLIAITPTNDSAEALKSLVDEVKTGMIGIDFDPAHFVMGGRSVSESLRQLHDSVLHVQLRDGTAGIDGGQEAVVGQGNVDWIEILAMLGEMDYRGWLTAIRTQGDDRARDLSRGLKFIRQLLLSH